MLAFLIITSLSLAFYLGLLVVLHHDGRKPRFKAGPVRKVKLGTVAELSTAVPVSTAAVAVGRQTRKLRAIAGEPAEVITLPRATHTKKDLQCG
jgi:hypothetical protein